MSPGFFFQPGSKSEYSPCCQNASALCSKPIFFSIAANLLNFSLCLDFNQLSICFEGATISICSVVHTHMSQCLIGITDQIANHFKTQTLKIRSRIEPWITTWQQAERIMSIPIWR